jgi:hypothetical protein
MYLLGMRYLEALPRLAEGKGSTIFLPMEAAGVMGAVGGLRELFARAGASAADPTRRPANPPTGALGLGVPVPRQVAGGRVDGGSATGE